MMQFRIPNIAFFNVKKAQQLFKNDIERTIDNILITTQRNIKSIDNVPVGATGQLRNTIQTERTGLTGKVFTGIFYAPIIEAGRSSAPVAKSADRALMQWITKSRAGQAYMSALKSKYKKITLQSAIYLLKRSMKDKPRKANPFFQRGIEKSLKYIESESILLLNKITEGLMK